MTLSILTHARDPRPVWHDLPWEAVRDLLSEYQFGIDKLAQPLFSPAEFGERKTKASVKAIHFGVLDLDDISPVALERAITAAAPYAALAFTTWSHPQAATRGLVRARLVVPFTRPVAPKDWPKVWANLTAAFGGNNDPKCSDPNRAYFVPSLPEGCEAARWVWRSSGTAAWNVDDAPKAPPPVPPSNDPIDSDTILKFAGRLIRSSDAVERRLGNLIKLGVSGTSIGAHGERNSTLWDMAGTLAAEFPYVNPTDLASLFGPCISHLRGEGSNQTVERFADQLARRQAPIKERIATQRIAEPVPGDWRETLSRDESGAVAPTLGNACKILRSDPELMGLVGYDELRACERFLRQPPSHVTESAIEDRDVTELLAWTESTHGVAFSPLAFYAALQAVARDRTYNPITDYLEGIVWDGQSRVGTWLVDYCGAAREHINHVFGARWLIACVARAYKPGVKADDCLVLKGRQGTKKTSLLQVLAGAEYFVTLEEDLASKAAKEMLHGKWIVELSEMESLSRSSLSSVKHFLSETIDTYREPYGRRTRDFLRRCMCAGTTNELEPLRDVTGDRRFWPVNVEDIDLEAVKRDRDQLWAEAVALFKAGEQHWLTRDEIALAEPRQAENRQIDEWEPLIAKMLEKRDEITCGEILAELGIVAGRINPQDGQRAGKALRALGWIPGRRTGFGRRPFVRGSKAAPKIIAAPTLSVVR